MSEFREWSTWIAGAIGGIVGFAFANYTEILDLIYPATISVAARPYPLDIVVALEPVGQRESVPLVFRGEGEVDSIKAKPGYYVLTTRYEDAVFDKKVIRLERGRNSSFGFPSPGELEGLFGELRFFVSGLKTFYAPGERMPLEVASNANGFVWAYEKKVNASTLLRVFPPESKPIANAISAGSSLRFTAVTEDGFYAESDPGNHQILFVLTSANDASLADALAGNLTGLDGKGFGPSKEIWGYFSHVYEVKRP
jgi:hypothetical protein